MDVRSQLLELRQHWKVPHDLDHSRPREVRLTSSGTALIALSVVLVIAALAVLTGLNLLVRRQAETARLLREEGVVTNGTITQLWRSRNKEKSPYMTYRFMSESGEYQKQARVSLAAWRQLRVGSLVAVRYVPAHPEINRPAASSDRILPVWVPFAAGAALAFFALLATFPVRSERRLLVMGRPAPGLVTRHGKMEHGQHGSKLGRKYYYEFPLLDGAIAAGKAGPVKEPPEIGRMITLLYDPENPERNAPYPFTLVMPEQASMEGIRK